MNLFNDILRDSEEPRGHIELHYDFLNRSAWKACERVRLELQDWFDKIPEEEQATLRRRFSSEFPAAFFELLLHELLVRSGFELVFHPEVKGTSHRPDFLAVRGGTAFYIEAVVATDLSEEEKAEAAVLHSLYEEVNRVDSPNFFLRLVTVTIPKGVQPAARRLKAFLKRNLDTTDPEEISKIIREKGIEGLPTWRFEDEGVIVEIQPISKSPKIRGKKGFRNIGIYPFQSRWGSVAPALRAVIGRKARFYGEPDQPFVIAVNSISEWGTDQIDIMETLFGTEKFTYSQGRLEPAMQRAPDGAFFGPSGPRNTRVSAVIVGCVFPWTLETASATLYHNPWASRSLSLDVLAFPQAMPREGTMEHLEGKSIVDLLGLPRSWPHVDEENAQQSFLADADDGAAES